MEDLAVLVGQQAVVLGRDRLRIGRSAEVALRLAPALGALALALGQDAGQPRHDLRAAHSCYYLTGCCLCVGPRIAL